MESDLFFPVTVPGLLPLWLSNKESVCTAGSLPGSGRSSGEGYGSPFQEFACKIPRTEEPGGLPSHGVAESDSTEVTEYARTSQCCLVRCPVGQSRTQVGGGQRWKRGESQPGLSWPGSLGDRLSVPLHWVSCVPLPESCHGASSMLLALRSSFFHGRNAPAFVWPIEQPQWLPRALSPGLRIWELV